MKIRNSDTSAFVISFGIPEDDFGLQTFTGYSVHQECLNKAFSQIFETSRIIKVIICIV